MRFTWNKVKNRQNIKSHGIDFTDVPSMFDHPLLTRIDSRHEYGEERWIAIGILKTLFAVVVYVERIGDEIRIISARKATKDERQYYEKEIADRL